MKIRPLAFLGLILWAALGYAQTATAPYKLEYPDMILYNGKIITVDNHDFTSNLGTIAQAMHIKDGKILQIGTNSEIRAMAGPNTKVIDLKGRTVIPGIILTHEHPWDWNTVEPYPVKAVLNDNNVITRFMDGSPDENVKAFPGVLSEAVSKAKPGQWIYIVLTYGKHYEYAPWGTGRVGRMGLDPKSYDPVGEGKGIINLPGLTAAAPNNPVVVRDVFVSMKMNQMALDLSRKVFSEPDVNPLPKQSNTSGGGEGGGGGPSFRWMFQNVVMKDYYPQLVQIMQLGMSWWAGYGLTTFASNVYDPMNVRVDTELDRKGEMPLRQMWSWNWRNKYFLSDQMYLNVISNLTGYGTDHFWFGGATIIQGQGCTEMPLLPSSSLANATGWLEGYYAKREKSCAYRPGTVYANLLYNYIKAGGRFINHHMIGDQDVDFALDTIYKASKDAGMTDDEIRAKRHTLDHSVMFPRPDQIPILHRMGMVVSGTPFEIYLGAPALFNLYGEKAVNSEDPKKSLVDGKVYTTLELDHAIGTSDLNIFTPISWMITRKSWDGKVYAPDQAVDRETALKISTIWGAYYLMKENSLGSLEPGKWADFAVLDRDYLTIPVDDIGKIRVLMTVVGGKIVHLVPSMADENGMQPAGAQVTLGGPAANW